MPRGKARCVRIKLTGEAAKSYDRLPASSGSRKFFFGKHAVNPPSARPRVPTLLSPPSTPQYNDGAQPALPCTLLPFMGAPISGAVMMSKPHGSRRTFRHARWAATDQVRSSFGNHERRSPARNESHSSIASRTHARRKHKNFWIKGTARSRTPRLLRSICPGSPW